MIRVREVVTNWGALDQDGFADVQIASKVSVLALWELPGAGHDTHQIGGHGWPRQGPVELEVEQLRRGLLGAPFDWSGPVHATASGWSLLLQVASDDRATMMWGGVGRLYYLVRPAEPPEEALFTWQCT